MTRRESDTASKAGSAVSRRRSIDETLLGLQRAAGNRAVASILGDNTILVGPKARAVPPYGSMGLGSPSAASRRVLQRLRYEGNEVDIHNLGREEARRFSTMIMENEVAKGDRAPPPYDLVYSPEDKRELERLSIHDVVDPQHAVSFQSTYSELEDETFVDPSLTKIVMGAPMRVRVQVRGTDPQAGQQARAVSIAPIQNLTGSAIIATYRNPTGGVTLDRAFRIFDRTLDAMTGSIYTDTPQPMTLNKQSFDELHFRDTPTIPMALRVQLPSHGTLSLESVRGQCSFVVWVVAVVDTYRFILERFRWQVQWDIRIVDDTIENRSSIESAGTVTEPAEPLVSGPLANDAYGDLQPTDRLWAI